MRPLRCVMRISCGNAGGRGGGAEGRTVVDCVREGCADKTMKCVVILCAYGCVRVGVCGYLRGCVGVCGMNECVRVFMCVCSSCVAKFAPASVYYDV